MVLLDWWINHPTQLMGLVFFAVGELVMLALVIYAWRD